MPGNVGGYRWAELIDSEGTWSAQLLLGEFRHSLDAKGRVFVPARWREELRGGVVLAQGLEGCVYVYALGKFEELADKLNELPVTRKASRDYSRLLFGTAQEEQLDKQGRITIPNALREWAGLERDVVVTGIKDRGEIWDASAWDSYRSEVEATYPEIAENLPI